MRKMNKIQPCNFDWKKNGDVKSKKILEPRNVKPVLETYLFFLEEWQGNLSRRKELGRLYFSKNS